MQILITGGAGFIGSHLADCLAYKTDASLVVLDNLSTGRKANLRRIDDDRLTLIKGDIRDEETTIKAVKEADVVYHLAAAVGVEKIVENPLESLHTNLHGTENVLQAAAEDGTPTFVASSSEVYGKSDDLPYSEQDDRVIGPTTTSRWSYSTAKAADEFLALGYHDKHDLPVVVGRFFNIVGPRQSGQYGMVIPTFVEQALAGKPLTVYGDGEQTRSFTHVREASRVVHELMKEPNAVGDVFNIGTRNAVSINTLAEQVIKITGDDSDITHIPFEEVYGPDFEEPEQRTPDLSKLHRTLGWEPNSELTEIIEDVVRERRPERTVVDDE